MPTPACESPDVGKRVAELRAEATRLLNCTCRRPDGGGEVDSSQCPVHKSGAVVPS